MIKALISKTHIAMKVLVKRLFLIAVLATISNILNAQVGIGIKSPNSGVILEVFSPTKGVLLPRITTLESAEKVEWSLIYDVASSKFKYCLGGRWLSINPLTTNEDGTDITAEGRLTVKTDLTVTGTVVNASSATVTGNTFVGYGTIPVGGIIMWSGGAVPDGWALCDGQTSNGIVTPDLRGRFIVGYQPGNTDYDTYRKTGGLNNITLTTDNLPKHNHDKGTLLNSTDGVHEHTFTGYEALDNGGSGAHVKQRNKTPGDPENDYGGNPAGAHTHTITGLTGVTGGMFIRYDQDLSGSQYEYFISEPTCSEEEKIWEEIIPGKGHWVSNPDYYLGNPSCRNSDYNPNYGKWNIPVYTVQPFDNRPAYYVLAFIIRVK